MRFKLFNLTGLSIILCLLSCQTGKEKKLSSDKENVFAGTITISGAFALYPLTVRWAEEYRKIHPDVKIDISAGGAGKGFTDVLSGVADLGMFSRNLSPEEIDKGCWYISVSRDAVVPTINANNPCIKDIKEKGLTKEKFQEIFISGKDKTWGKIIGNGNTQKINVYTRSDACGAAETWAKYLGKKQEDLEGTGVNGDPGMADALKSDKLGIGYNNVNFAFDRRTKHTYPGIVIVPIDINGDGKIEPEEYFYNNLDDLVRAITDGKYPSPPARDLYFISKGKPVKGNVIEFLKWVLTEGQKYVSEAGYVKLSEETIRIANDKLK